MNAQQERVFQSFRRVQGWWTAHQSWVSTEAPKVAPAISAQVEALNGIVARLTDHITAQETQQAQTMLISKDEREQRKELLTHHMATIVKLAKALRGQVPGIGVLSMPKGNIQSAALTTAASVMARKAEIYRSVLVENGLPTDFRLGSPARPSDAPFADAPAPLQPGPRGSAPLRDSPSS